LFSSGCRESCECRFGVNSLSTGFPDSPIIHRLDHPMDHLFEAGKGKVVGVSCGCSGVFGARAEAESGGYALFTENAVPGTSGLPSLSRLISERPTVLTF
jgi:hypothetical protein